MLILKSAITCDSNVEIKKVYWVAIEIINTKWEILFIIEWENKVWKKEWQISVPMGTIEKWELPINTLIRELKEEVLIDILKEDINIWDIKEIWDFVMYVNGVNIHLKKYRLQLRKEIEYWIPEWEEIKDVFWSKKNYLKNKKISKIRPWLLEIIWENNNNSSSIVFIENWTYNTKINYADN
jgi:8-oxo-dGTP pyrophosphatase MutT (NUDIX family)